MRVVKRTCAPRDVMGFRELESWWRRQSTQPKLQPTTSPYLRQKNASLKQMYLRAVNPRHSTFKISTIHRLLQFMLCITVSCVFHRHWSRVIHHQWFVFCFFVVIMWVGNFYRREKTSPLPYLIEVPRVQTWVSSFEVSVLVPCKRT